MQFKGIHLTMSDVMVSDKNDIFGPVQKAVKWRKKENGKNWICLGLNEGECDFRSKWDDCEIDTFRVLCSPIFGSIQFERRRKKTCNISYVSIHFVRIFSHSFLFPCYKLVKCRPFSHIDPHNQHTHTHAYVRSHTFSMRW